ncbi:MAG: NADH-quinone oxidoreductase subunit M [Planctomycetota bacterium]|nr:NADH-quinone oxidoreductase subunit M [Planctomycetota bacterium]
MDSIFDLPLLSAMIAAPFLGIVLLAFVACEVQARRIALACALVSLALSLIVVAGFQPNASAMQFVERVDWMPSFHIEYAVGVDGVSILLVLLTTLLTPLCLLCSWTSITSHVRAFMMLTLLVEGAILLVFTTMDLFLFFVMWEVTMIPMYFMILIWGGPGRTAASLKFILYSLTGSLLLLVGILGLYLQAGASFDLIQLREIGPQLSDSAQCWMFLAFLLAFVIKLPMFPFHTWLPEAHGEAPTAGSVLLAGVLLKMGGYGLLRICVPLFPDAAVTFAPWMLWLSLVGILYGGAMALAQEDIKKLVAYSSISHMGFVTLGIFVFNQQGTQGAILQMFNHGIVTGAMFLAVGQLYERTHSRLIRDYGGLYQQMPRFVTFFTLFAVASFGLPGTSSFIGEILVLTGAADKHLMIVMLTMGGIVLAAAYILWLLQRVVLGHPQTPLAAQLPDITARECVTLAPLALLVLAIGVYPLPLMRLMQTCVGKLVQEASQGSAINLSGLF